MGGFPKYSWLTSKEGRRGMKASTAKHREGTDLQHSFLLYLGITISLPLKKVNRLLSGIQMLYLHCME